jgi:hypothetical protein
VRFMIAMAFAALLLIPAGAASRAGSAPMLTAYLHGSFDVSSAKRKKAKRKAVKKEQYLRAVPSTPPPGTKM